MELFSFTFDEIFMTFPQKGMRKKYLESKEKHDFFRLVCNLSPQILKKKKPFQSLPIDRGDYDEKSEVEKDRM